ncbi:hypothetical protein [Chitinophaga sp.]|uniref:DUF6934 family protein n=1 Tax=Chitinophaga sp. TaxID=1869181 RepID=UPI0026028D20|nr:hypothetical protein [uncultured Chitinophaga sp.]
MDLDSYPVYSSADLLTHTFESEGPKGIILKQVKFQRIEKDRYNLAFGDREKESAHLNDMVRSNNNDRDKVLASVARIISIFLGKFPNAYVEVAGSTSSRTRLYQMKLLARLQQINEQYMLQGYTNGHWENFQTGRKYTTLSITTKMNSHESE